MTRNSVTIISETQQVEVYLQLLNFPTIQLENIETLCIEAFHPEELINVKTKILVIDDYFPFDKYEINKLRTTKILFIGRHLEGIIKHSNIFRILDPEKIDYTFAESIYECIQLLDLEFHNYKSEITGKPLFDFISVNSTQKIELLKKDDIIFFEAEGRYTKIHLSNGNQKMASRNIGDYQKILDKEIFCRVHHKYIVNLKNLKAISKSDGLYCEMINQKNVPISKRKLEDLLSILNTHA